MDEIKVKQLTPLDRKVFLFIDNYISKERRPPSQKEIATYCCHKTLSAIQPVLDKLEFFDYIQRIPGEARSIRLTDEGLKFIVKKSK